MSNVTFVYVTYIATTAEKVWNALIDSEMTKDYWGYHKNVSDWNPGSPWSHADYESGIADVVGTVIESAPPHKLVLTWESAQEAFRGPQPSRVTFLIEPFMDVVRLTVMHEEIEPDSPMHVGVTKGWPAILSSLKTMLETGQAMSMTRKRWQGPPK